MWLEDAKDDFDEQDWEFIKDKLYVDEIIIKEVGS